MGCDKATLGPPGRSMAALVARALRAAGMCEVVLVGGDWRRLSRVGDAWIPDERPGEGPLAALGTVARCRRGRPLLVCACDLPELTSAALVPFLRALDEGVAVAVAEVDGVAQWSVVAVGAVAAERLISADGPLARGVRSLREGLGELGVPCRLGDVDPAALADADAPADLPPRLRRWVGVSEPAGRRGSVNVVSETERSIEEIDVDGLARAMENGAVVVDVRNPDEFEQFRVPGVLLIPLPEFEVRHTEIPPGDPVYVICRSGARSLRACEFLASRGRRAVNVAGGTLAWVEAGRPVDSGPVR
jgi:rhodanese-related sulfurtransferase/molybdopterin-guanine dinucleotide biosynthesis protein A